MGVIDPILGTSKISARTDFPVNVTGRILASAGSDLDVVYVQLVALGVIAAVLVRFSAWKFRGQMS
jgi:hypothetical protein